MRGQKLPALALVERGAVGGEGEDGVVLAELEPLGHLDRGNEVGDAGKAEESQIRATRGVDVPAVRQIGAARCRC